MSKFISKQSVAIWYVLSALFTTYIVGQVILWCFPDRTSLGASLLFILMNCVPLIMAAVFSRVLSEVKSLGEFFKKVFLRNVSFTGNTFLAFLLYFPWTFLYGGLEEVGWRWFLQEHLYFSKHFITKMMVLSIVWFLWHIPIYQLPWITAGSSNYLIFYLMILGNTFLFGALKEYSKGAAPSSEFSYSDYPSGYFRNPTSLLAGGGTKIIELELNLPLNFGGSFSFLSVDIMTQFHF